MTGDTRAPESLGPYRLLRKIGEGGMGVVHLGLDEDGREVAVKVLHPHVAADLKARDRLTREVETMRRVRSQHVAEVLDAELTAKQPYIVTRFAPGRTLEETVLEDGPLPADEVIRLAQGMCAALVAIHAADVIHRDFKPSNVMIVNGDPLVIDFGIAHLVNATRLTQTGMFVGTPATSPRRSSAIPRSPRRPTCTRWPRRSSSARPASRRSARAASRSSASTSWRAGPTST